MKRVLLTLMCLTTFGMAVAGPPVDVQLVCGEGEDAPLVGVASLVEDQLHVALIEGALDACADGVYGVADDATVFTVSFVVVDGVLDDVQVVFVADPEFVPALTYAEVPEVAALGKLGAQQNRAMAHERATQARERAAEHAGGPIMNAPDDGADGEEEEVEAEGEEGDGPPADLPAPATRGRR